MNITINIKENKELEAWDIDKFHAQSTFPPCECASQDADAAINHVKGMVLCTLGEWAIPPDKIEFNVVKL